MFTISLCVDAELPVPHFNMSMGRFPPNGFRQNFPGMSDMPRFPFPGGDTFGPECGGADVFSGLEDILKFGGLDGDGNPLPGGSPGFGGMNFGGMGGPPAFGGMGGMGGIAGFGGIGGSPGFGGMGFPSFPGLGSQGMNMEVIMIHHRFV